MANIVAANPVIYDHYDPAFRDVVENLAEVPMVDSTGKEKRIYNEAGVKIPRRRAIPFEGERTWAGLLMDVKNIDSLFQRGAGNRRGGDSDADSDEDEVEDALTDTAPLSLSVYPQCFTSKWGHFQANTLMHIFDAPIKKINDDWKYNGDDRRGNSTLITADSCQGYNELSHRTSPRAGEQDVQQGLITASIMRGAGLSTSEQTKTAKWRESCVGALPHDRVRDKILLPDCPRSYRMEHVYNIDNWAFPEDVRNGR